MGKKNTSRVRARQKSWGLAQWFIPCATTCKRCLRDARPRTVRGYFEMLVGTYTCNSTTAAALLRIEMLCLHRRCASTQPGGKNVAFYCSTVVDTGSSEQHTGALPSEEDSNVMEGSIARIGDDAVDGDLEIQLNNALLFRACFTVLLMSFMFVLEL
jgi:hypothetical protein